MIEAANYTHGPDVGAIHVRTRALQGTNHVGICHFHSVYAKRIDQQDSTPRQFMVSAFYPADAANLCDSPSNARFVELLEPVVDEALNYLLDGIDPTTRDEAALRIKSIGMRAIRGASPQRNVAPHPTLIYYPAGGCNRFANVDICEGLASLGFVVLALDGPHDADVVVFPDGNLCLGPLKGDYISPGVGDVSYLISQIDELNREGMLAGMMDRDRIGIFGHSRGGYIANISAFLNDEVKAAASIDSFLWGYMTKKSGLERHPLEFRKKVKSTAKPILRLCGRPAGSDEQAEAEFCLNRDGGDFVGDFTVIAMPGWGHGDFVTTPWLCGKGQKLIDNQLRESAGAETLTDILATFFSTQFLGAASDQMEKCIMRRKGLGLAQKLSTRIKRQPIKP